MTSHTENGMDYVNAPQAEEVCRAHLYWKICTVIILALLFQNEAAAEEKLKAGIWKGTFLTHDGMLYRIQFIVSYDNESQEAPAKIKMINLDLEPASEFTYQLADIHIEGRQLRFKIPKVFETKVCALQIEDGAYSGTCSSDAGAPGETSEITMVPPAGGIPQSN